jgi:hypothetical protein
MKIGGKRKPGIKGFIKQFFGIRPWQRHSLVLMVSGLAYAATGLSYIITEPTVGRQQALIVALDRAPIQFWGGVFIICGILSMISSRWPPFTETWGYMVLTGLSAGWSATYTTGVLFENSPDANLSGGLVWGLLAFMWWAISGLLNPDKTAVTNNGSR